MEDKNNLPSIPSNYVTLAQLQERWLKQKEKEKQLQEKQQEEQQQKQQQQIPKLPQHNPREYHGGRRPKTQQLAWRAIPACPTGSGHAAGECPPAESGPKNPNVPESNRVAVEVSLETNESVEAEANIGDGNDGRDGKKKQSKKKQKSGKRKPRADEEEKKLAEDATESTMAGNKEVVNSDVQRIDAKAETKIELNDSKSNDLMMKVGQKLGTMPMDSENEKKNSGVKTHDSSRGSQRNNGGRNHKIGPHGRADKEKKKLAEDATQSTMVGNKEVADSDVQRVDDKRETKVELNGGKSNDLVMEDEQKLGTTSMNSENEKHNSRVTTYDSSRGSHRNNGGRRTGPYGRADKEKKKLAEDATQSTMARNKEVANSGVQRIDEKTVTKIELNDSSNDLMMEVEQKLGTIPMNSENDKRNSRVKTYDSSRGSQRNRGGRRIGPRGRADKEKKKLVEDATQSAMVGNKEVANSNGQGVDDNRETKIELNGSKNNDSGTISMNSENEKQNSRVKTYDSSRGSRRNIGGRNYKIGPYCDRDSNFGPYGGKIHAHDQKIWVRKSEHSNGNVDHNDSK